MGFLIWLLSLCSGYCLKVGKGLEHSITYNQIYVYYNDDLPLLAMACILDYAVQSDYRNQSWSGAIGRLKVNLY